MGNYVMARENILDLDEFYGDEMLNEEERTRLFEVYHLLDQHEDKISALQIGVGQNFIGLDQDASEIPSETESEA